MWLFRNDEKPFPYEKFRPISTFNPRKKDTVIETYLSSLEERLLEIDISSKRFNNLTKEESNALYNLRDAPTIIITGADKGSAVVIWDRDNYLKEASMQLEDKDVYKEVQNDPSTLISIIIYASGYEVISLMIHSITSWSKILNLLDSTFYLRFTKICIMFLADSLFQIVDSIQKISPHF